MTLGLFSLLLSVAWPWLANSTELMTEEEAEQYTQATMDHHRLGHAYAQQQDDFADAVPNQAMQAAEAKFETLFRRQARLREWRDHGGLKYRWLGIGLVLLGVAIVFISQRVR